MKSAKQILNEAATQPNDDQSRAERMKMVEGLCDRIIEFRDALRERGRGPSIKQTGRILDDVERRILKMRLWDED